ncbi:MAG: DnaA N-terminal domain-containing protein [Anaerolineales bacterium]
MNAEQAWQSALGQLQMEMPKASFDTWVRDTHLASYEDGLFTISVRNAYARDWLESRLSSTAMRLLMGIMNRSVEVQFMVANEEPAEEEDADPEPVEADPTNRASATEVPNGSAAGTGKDNYLEVEARYDLAYDEIVAPDHVTVVPGYFRKHLRVIGPDLGWLYLGFRQSAFNSGGRSGSKHARFSGQAIAALSGIAESTFWNRIGKVETWERLKGLVSTSANTPEWDTSSATPKRLPRRYTVSMTLPMTAADARSLRAWLTANLESLGGPEKVIEAAAEMPLDDLLPLNAQAQDGDVPETVVAILRSLFGALLPAERLAALATRLHKHIMPDSDRLGVTHFFVEHVLPYLGTGPGWLLTLLRDRCWVNRKTGEVRSQVRIPGGYGEIGDWLGVTPETVWRWLYGKHSESRGRSKPREKGGVQRGSGRQATEAGKLSFPILSVYLRETTPGKAASFATSPRTFKVLLDEIPAEILEAALDDQADQALTRALDDGANLALGDGDFRAVCSIGLARFAVSPDPLLARFVVSENPVSARFALSESPIPAPARFVGSSEPIPARFVASSGSIPARFVDDGRAVCSIVTARFVDHLRAVCRVFKSLNLLNPITNDSPTTPLPPTNSSEEISQQPIRSGGGMGNQAFWDFNFLMQNNQVAKASDIQKRQKATGASIETLAQGFVSWLLYAYSPSGRRIEDPVALAAKRLLENIHTGAGGDFDRMAHLKPFELKTLFDHDLGGDLWEVDESTEKSIYVVNYGHLTGPYKRELYRRLFGGE